MQAEIIIHQDDTEQYRASLMVGREEEATANISRSSFESDEDFQDAVDNAKTQLNQSLEEANQE